MAGGHVRLLAYAARRRLHRVCADWCYDFPKISFSALVPLKTHHPKGGGNREGEKNIWWTARTARGGTGHLGRTETQRGRRWTACGQRCVNSKHSQTTPATTSTSSIRQLLGAADTQTAHHATFSTVPTRQLLGSANAETTPARAPAAAADRK